MFKFAKILHCSFIGGPDDTEYFVKNVVKTRLRFSQNFDLFQNHETTYEKDAAVILIDKIALSSGISYLEFCIRCNVIWRSCVLVQPKVLFVK